MFKPLRNAMIAVAVAVLLTVGVAPAATAASAPPTLVELPSEANILKFRLDNGSGLTGINVGAYTVAGQSGVVLKRVGTTTTYQATVNVGGTYKVGLTAKTASGVLVDISKTTTALAAPVLTATEQDDDSVEVVWTNTKGVKRLTFDQTVAEDGHIVYQGLNVNRSNVPDDEEGELDYSYLAEPGRVYVPAPWDGSTTCLFVTVRNDAGESIDSNKICKVFNAPWHN